MPAFRKRRHCQPVPKRALVVCKLVDEHFAPEVDVDGARAQLQSIGTHILSDKLRVAGGHCVGERALEQESERSES